MSTPSCAYLVSRYPGVTHTFVVGEVLALRAAGVRVETASIRRVAAAEVLSETDREEHRRTRALLPVGPVRLARAHVRALAASPRTYVGTLVHALRLAPAGGRARLWQLFYFAEAALLWEWMREHELHHVHVHHADVAADVALLTCRLAAGSEGRAWTWSLTVHGPTDLLDAASHKLAVKAADAAAVVCISDFARREVQALLDPLTAAKLHTVRCGIDITAFRPPPEGRGRGAGFTILCVAALSGRKGHHVLLDAFRRVLDAQPGTRLVLVGDGPERAALGARCAELRLTGAVRFAGAVGHDRLGEEYGRADAFCLPSFAEGIPTVLMEAMATGLPVVSTDVMGVPELVEHERSGLLVPPARADLLAHALLRLIDDAGLRDRLGHEGRRRVVTHYQRGAAVEALRAVLDPLLSAPPADPPRAGLS